jgi:hypothetical protein
MKTKYFATLLLFIPSLNFCMEDEGLFSPMESESEAKDREEQVINTINERLEKNLDLNANMGSPFGNQKPLHRAIHHDRTGQLALKLLTAGADPNALNCWGETPLHWACAPRELSLENIKILLTYNANPNILDAGCYLTPTSYGETPLHSLCGASHSTDKQIALKLLLAHGANPLEKNGYGKTCLELLSEKDPKLGQIATRIYEHKIAAYVLLLRGKETNESLFRRLPKELLKLILDNIFSNFPWPEEILNSAKLLDLLKPEQKQIKGDS